MKIETKKNKNLSEKEKQIINKWRKKEFGPQEVKNFKKDYEPNTEWFFVEDNNKIVAFGGLRPITINYLGKKYKIFGICSIISIKKRKGYGKKLIAGMIDYAKRNGKTILGFTTKTKFFRNAGLRTKRNFTWRFALKNPKTGKIKFDSGDCDGIYYEGKDNFIKKILKTKSIVYYHLPDIKMPHW